MTRTGYVDFNSQKLRRTSPPDNRYNCIAWAAEDKSRWWWCSPPFAYWPPTAPIERTLEAFKAAFETLGYRECENGSLESGFKKIAIFSGPDGPTHAARQLNTGLWTSKLGKLEDVEHELEQVEGTDYGGVAMFMKRRDEAY